jgi:hypothetical protein
VEDWALKISRRTESTRSPDFPQDRTLGRPGATWFAGRKIHRGGFGLRTKSRAEENEKARPKIDNESSARSAPGAEKKSAQTLSGKNPCADPRKTRPREGILATRASSTRKLEEANETSEKQGLTGERQRKIFRRRKISADQKTKISRDKDKHTRKNSQILQNNEQDTQDGKINFFIENQQDYNRFTDVTVLPPFFNY